MLFKDQHTVEPAAKECFSFYHINFLHTSGMSKKIRKKIKIPLLKNNHFSFNKPVQGYTLEKTSMPSLNARKTCKGDHAVSMIRGLFSGRQL